MQEKGGSHAGEESTSHGRLLARPGWAPGSGFASRDAGGSHTASATYLYLGLHGYDALVPWIWSALGMNVAAAALLLTARTSTSLWRIDIACVLTFTAIWIEKGMGLVVPGFVPSTLHEMVEYFPTVLEWKIVVGIWALGLIVFTLGVKIAIAVFRNRMHVDEEVA